MRETLVVDEKTAISAYTSDHKQHGHDHYDYIHFENDYYANDYEPSGDVLSNDAFHGVVWILLSTGIIGNVLVVVWRFSQKRDQRSSPLSILIVMLAISDFLYCVHLLLLESLVAQSSLDETPYMTEISDDVCVTSGCLSFFSCLTAQWAVFNIAVYSFQGMTEACSRCCCSLLRKRCLIITIICQVLFVVAVTLLLSLPVSNVGVDRLEDSKLQQEYIKIVHNDSLNSTGIMKDNRNTQISEIFGRCAWAQSCGYDFCTNGYTAITYDNLSIISNFTYCASNYNDLFSFSSYLSSTSIASINSVITLTCAILYLLVFVNIRRSVSQANIAGTSDIHNLQWRLSTIVLLNTVCWIPATVLHWIVIYDLEKRRSMSDSYANSSTSASIILISISPAVNPLIYTFTGKHFLSSIRKCYRQLKCDISLRRNRSSYIDDPITGIERCTCIPCVKCVHRFEDFETPDWSTEKRKLLQSANEST